MQSVSLTTTPLLNAPHVNLGLVQPTMPALAGRNSHLRTCHAPHKQHIILDMRRQTAAVVSANDSTHGGALIIQAARTVRARREREPGRRRERARGTTNTDLATQPTKHNVPTNLRDLEQLE
jgi:hypothetical protein